MEKQDAINNMQLTQQNMHKLLMQRHQLQLQLNETQSALDAIKDSKEAYKVIGNVMVLTDTQDLVKELEEKKETTDIQLKNIDKQEEALKQKTQEMQEKMMKELEKK